MRRTIGLLALAALSACRGGVQTLDGPAGTGDPSVRAAYVIPADANVIVSMAEAVAGPEEDRPTYLKVFIDGREAGQTEIGPRSAPKRWGARLEPGNKLLRLEKWEEPQPGQWFPLQPAWQPQERFVRVDAATRAAVTVRFTENGRRHSFQVSREPIAP